MTVVIYEKTKQFESYCDNCRSFRQIKFLVTMTIYPNNQVLRGGPVRKGEKIPEFALRFCSKKCLREYFPTPHFKIAKFE